MQMPIGPVSDDHSCWTCVCVHILSGTWGHNIFKATAVKGVTTLQLVQNECLFSSQVKGMQLVHHKRKTLSYYCAFTEGDVCAPETITMAHLVCNFN